MKRILSVVILGLIVILSTFAQNSKNQLTRDLSSFSPLKSPNQQIIEQVVNSGVFIIKDSYELADSANNRYGLNGNRAFSTDYSLGIKVKNGFLVTNRTVNPWDYNPLFDQYRAKYTPKLFPYLFSEISENAHYEPIAIHEDSLFTLFSGLLFAQGSEQFSGDGFSVGGNIGDNDGWIVWFTKKRSSDFSRTTDLSLSIVKKKLSIMQKNENESYFYQVDSLVTVDEVVGGIFVMPEIISVGRMELRLCGVACKIENGWMLCCPFVNSKTIFAPIEGMDRSAKVNMLKSDKPQLTPNQNEDDMYNTKKTGKSKNKTKKQ